MQGVWIGYGGCRTGIDPEPKLRTTDLGIARPFGQMNTGVLGEKEGEDGEVRFVGEWTRPEHMVETGIFWVAGLGES